MAVDKAEARDLEEGLLLVVSGPSGVGKDTILAEAGKHLPHLRRSVSVTTRPPRKSETDGVDYFFVSPAEFDRMKRRGEMLEWAQYIDYYYGTPRAWVSEQLQSGEDVALEIDVQGGRQIKEKFPKAVLIFVKPPTEAALRERLSNRNTETETSLERRLEAYREEYKQIGLYDYEIINDDLDEAVGLFRCIVRAEKAKVRKGR